MPRPVLRQIALDRLSSPERLDRPVRLVSPLTWLGLGVLVAAIIAVGVWAVVVQAPVKVASRGILLETSGLLEITASKPGRIDTLDLRPGQTLVAGDTVAIIGQPDLARQIDQAAARLDAARERTARLDRFHAESRVRKMEADRERSETIAATQALLRDRLELLDEQLASTRLMVDQRALPRDRLLEVEVDVADVRERLAILDDEAALIRLRRLDREAERSNELLDQRLDVEDLEREHARLTRLLAERRVIASPYAGTVVEVMVDAGEVVQPGTALATVQPAADGDAGRLYALLFVPAQDGKQVRPGMAVELAPSTVRRETHGYLLGQVAEVAPLPATVAGIRRRLRNDELVRQLTGTGAPFEARIELLTDEASADGWRWSSSRGPAVALNAGTLVEGGIIVRRVRLAGLLIPGLDRLVSHNP